MSQGDFTQNSISQIYFKEMIDKLEETERMIIDMKLIGELTFKEIAKILKSPMGTVTWKYKKAMDKLRMCKS